MKGALFLEYRLLFYQPSKCHCQYAFLRITSLPTFLFSSPLYLIISPISDRFLFT